MGEPRSVEQRGRGATSLERISETELVWRRRFRAPAAVVFEAYTSPEQVRRWWAPASRGVALTVCEADVRTGGRYRYVMARGAEVVCAFTGTYREVERPARLVSTQGLEGAEGGEVVATATFEERDGVTTLTVHERYPSKALLEELIEMGMEDGALEAFEQLGALVAAQAR